MADQTKRQLVRDYIMCLIGEGTFRDVKTPLETIARASAVFAKDVGGVIGEMSAQFAEMNGNKLHIAAVESVRDFIGGIAERGLRAAWADLQEQHKRGMDANARNRSR